MYIKNSFNIIPETTNYDLNGDGKIGLSDISIFMANFFTYNPRFDFNNDSKVNTADLSMLLEARNNQ